MKPRNINAATQILTRFTTTSHNDSPCASMLQAPTTNASRWTLSKMHYHNGEGHWEVC